MNTYLDGRAAPERRFSRFLVFGLAVILAIGTLTARLFYLQISNGTEFTAISNRQRTVEAGFRHHLVKPVAMDKLKVLLQSVQAPRAGG